MKRAVHASKNRSDPVLRYMKPEDLLKKLDFKLPMEGASHKELLGICEAAFDYSMLPGELEKGKIAFMKKALANVV